MKPAQPLDLAAIRARIGRYVTTTVVRLSADDWQEIASIVERAERRRIRGRR